MWCCIIGTPATGNGFRHLKGQRPEVGPLLRASSQGHSFEHDGTSFLTPAPFISALAQATLLFFFFFLIMEEALRFLKFFFSKEMDTGETILLMSPELAYFFFFCIHCVYSFTQHSLYSGPMCCGDVLRERAIIPVYEACILVLKTHVGKGKNRIPGTSKPVVGGPESGRAALREKSHIVSLLLPWRVQASHDGGQDRMGRRDGAMLMGLKDV